MIRNINFLKALEYGALPSFELTYAPSSDLQRTMEDRLFSSEFDYWFEESIEEYEKYADIYEGIYNQAIVNHEQLDQELFRTTYANGNQVIVNYGREVVKLDGVDIKGNSYALVKGENN